MPQTLGFETAALATVATPSPPFGAGITYLQGVGAPTNRPGSGLVVPELAPLESVRTNFLAAHSFEAGTLALIMDSKLVVRQGYGWRDTNFTAVIHPDNLFRLASVAEMLTAFSNYKLVAAGINQHKPLPPLSTLSGELHYTAMTNAVANITSWPVSGGGIIQWATTATKVNKLGGNITVPRVRSGANTLPVKVSFTTYALTASPNTTKPQKRFNFDFDLLPRTEVRCY